MRCRRKLINHFTVLGILEPTDHDVTVKRAYRSIWDEHLRRARTTVTLAATTLRWLGSTTRMSCCSAGKADSRTASNFERVVNRSAARSTGPSLMTCRGNHQANRGTAGPRCRPAIARTTERARLAVPGLPTILHLNRRRARSRTRLAPPNPRRGCSAFLVGSRTGWLLVLRWASSSCSGCW